MKREDGTHTHTHTQNRQFRGPFGTRVNVKRLVTRCDSLSFQHIYVDICIIQRMKSTDEFINGSFDSGRITHQGSCLLSSPIRIGLAIFCSHPSAKYPQPNHFSFFFSFFFFLFKWWWCVFFIFFPPHSWVSICGKAANRLGELTLGVLFIVSIHYFLSILGAVQSFFASLRGSQQLPWRFRNTLWLIPAPLWRDPWITRDLISIYLFNICVKTLSTEHCWMNTTKRFVLSFCCN